MMPQMPSREKLLAWIDQVSFAVVEMNLYLDTHPEDEDALAVFPGKSGASKRSTETVRRTVRPAHDRYRQRPHEPFFRMGYAAMAVGSQPERRVLTDVEL